eukprot:155849-Amphidinium_carterae.1
MRVVDHETNIAIILKEKMRTRRDSQHTCIRGCPRKTHTYKACISRPKVGMSSCQENYHSYSSNTAERNNILLKISRHENRRTSKGVSRKAQQWSARSGTWSGFLKASELGATTWHCLGHAVRIARSSQEEPPQGLRSNNVKPLRLCLFKLKGLV